jgi:hypothetical protein
MVYDDWEFEESECTEQLEPVELTEEEHIRMTCEIMLEYLQRSYLEVAVNRENYTRMVCGQNTKWYQDFCAAYQSCAWIYRNGKKTKLKKRPRTFIKRCHTIAALKRMINGDFRGEYATRLMEFVEEFWATYAEGY